LDPAESGLTDYFLLCNGTNDRQNVAIADEIELRLKRDFKTYPNSVEGRRHAEWILLDYVDFIVHIFSPEKRAFYGLERLRKSATSLNIDELNAEIKSQIASARSKKKAPAATAKKAPAKKAIAKKTTAKKATAGNTRTTHPAKKSTKAATTPKVSSKRTAATKRSRPPK
jgi:ribosome-associated protein